MGSKNLKVILRNHPSLKKVLAPLLNFRKKVLFKKQINQEAIIDRLSKLMLNDPVLKIDEFEGSYVLDVRSHLFKRILLEEEYEPELVKCCLRYIDKTKDIVDVGANIGFFTCLFSKQLINNKVLAIEPTSNALKRLKQNIVLNKLNDNIILFEGVVSDKIGDLEIKTIKGKEEYSSLGGMNHPGIATEQFTTEKVKSSTLDDLIIMHNLNPGFIKIDVEGAENMVFSGGKEVLSKKRPVILSEMCDFLLKKNGSSASEVITLIEKYDYDVINPSDPDVDPKFVDFGDVLCFPKERNLMAKHFQ